MKAENINNILRKHKGQWVAIKGGKSIAMAKTHREIYKKLAMMKANGAYVLYAPTANDKKIPFLFEG